MFCGWGHRVSCACAVCATMLSAHNCRWKKRKRGRKKPSSSQKEMTIMKKPGTEAKFQLNKPLEESAWSDAYHTLWDYLTTSVYDCGTIRLTSSITFFCQEGVLKCCVNDRDTERTAFFTGPTMESLLEAVEQSLASDDCDWRVKKGTPAQNKPPF